MLAELWCPVMPCEMDWDGLRLVSTNMLSWEGPMMERQGVRDAHIGRALWVKQQQKIGGPFFCLFRLLRAHDNILKSRTSSIEKYYKDDYRDNVNCYSFKIQSLAAAIFAVDFSSFKSKCVECGTWDITQPNKSSKGCFHHHCNVLWHECSGDHMLLRGIKINSIY